MARNRRGNRVKEQRQLYPLSGRVKGQCGGRYTGVRCKDPSGRVYRCSGKTEKYAKAPICSCSRIHADSLEQRIWMEVCTLLGDRDRLCALAEDWAGLASGGKINFEQRIAELDRQIEAQDAAIAAVMVVAAKQENPANAIEKAARTLNEEREQLVKMKSEVLAWQVEAEEASQRIQDLEALAQLARDRLHNMPPEQQREVLDLMDVRVMVTGPVPKVRKADCSLTRWFRQRGRPVPVLTDKEWAKIEPVLTAARKRQRKDCLSDREVMEAILHKARTGHPWPSTGYQSRYQRWAASGLWEEIMDLLADAEGTPVPPAGALPPLRVEGRVDPRLLVGVGSTPHSTVATSKGISDSDAYPFSPWTVSAFGCTGTMRLP
ncbi:transposase [Streptomyces flaveus]|uniref:Transposase n=1 Tax=Streptomyces flaveus TaxID=66370 RepID=A0A917RFR6_9ACTN|nr:transposase [Streptomyces flaveus]GGL05599.1 hypothetical protein GCM10010094_77950 [Streptomyces flaveus]